MSVAAEDREPSPTGELESLMVRYQQADGLAAGVLVNTLSPRIFHFFLSQVRDRARAEDLVQDLWLRIHKARHTYRPGEPVLPWIYAIVRRTSIDQYRKQRRIAAHETSGERLPEMPAPEPPPEASANIAELLSSLPPAQREVILMLKVSGLSLEEVARATGATVGSVKQKAHRGYEKLRLILRGER